MCSLVLCRVAVVALALSLEIFFYIIGIMQNALAGRELFPVGDVGAYAVDFLKVSPGFRARDNLPS